MVACHGSAWAADCEFWVVKGLIRTEWVLSSRRERIRTAEHLTLRIGSATGHRQRVGGRLGHPPRRIPWIRCTLESRPCRQREDSEHLWATATYLICSEGDGRRTIEKDFRPCSAQRHQTVLMTSWTLANDRTEENCFACVCRSGGVWTVRKFVGYLDGGCDGST